STDAPELLGHFANAAESIAEAFETREYARAMREIMGLADRANQYIDARKPWVMAKDPAQRAALHEVCSTGIELFRLLVVYLKPVLPFMAREAEAFLACAPLQWADHARLLGRHRIQAFKPLMSRIEPARVAAMVQDSVDRPAVPPAPAAADA